MRIVLLGPQGSGKGTQSERLSALTGARHISVGDLVRNEIRADTPLGRSIRAYNDRGELVPDPLIAELIRPILVTEHNWILDGFPRDLEQARALDAELKRENLGLDKVVALEAPDDVLIERLAGRRQSASTGAIYHVVHNPPPTSDPGPFVQRVDDAPDQIRRRLEIYHDTTEPLKEYYDRQGLLADVDADGPIDEVTHRILNALGISPSQDRNAEPGEPSRPQPAR
ncbi:MAG TPA: adenylate kinase [Chloroflexota bacterium]